MKKILFVAILMLISMNIQAKQPFAVDISFDAFYTNLSPYGEWIEIDNGVVVWHPLFVERNWQPYSNGRWVYTENGWYWDSYEKFGWATAHYGRWLYDDYHGWIWFPDYEWGPAWVEWRYGNDNIGWAPLPPYAKFTRTNGIVFSISWKSNYYHWRFVNYAHFCNHNVAMFYQPVRYNKHIWGKTTYHTKYRYRNDRIYNNGISRDIIEQRSHRKIREANIEISNTISPSKTRENNGRIVSYRPVSSKSRNGNYEISKRHSKSSNFNRDKLVVGRNNNITSTRDKVTEKRVERSENKINNRTNSSYKEEKRSNTNSIKNSSRKSSKTKSINKSTNDNSKSTRSSVSRSSTRKR